MKSKYVIDFPSSDELLCKTYEIFNNKDRISFIA